MVTLHDLTYLTILMIKWGECYNGVRLLRIFVLCMVGLLLVPTYPLNHFIIKRSDCILPDKKLG